MPHHAEQYGQVSLRQISRPYAASALIPSPIHPERPRIR
jgi:hypothetical protein